MKGDEFKKILEDINDKFDTLIEGQNLLNERIDRHITPPIIGAWLEDCVA